MDTIFFIASKLVWGLIRVESWIIIGLVLTVWGVWRNCLTLARRDGIDIFGRQHDADDAQPQQLAVHGRRGLNTIG